MSRTFFNYRDIVSSRLTKGNIDEYAELLGRFNSGDEIKDSFIRSRTDLIRQDKYDNRDLIYLYFYRDSDTNERDLIGYVSCSASSLLGQINDELEVTIPTVCIKGWGIDSAYNGVIIKDSPKKKYKINLYILMRFINSMKDLSEHIGINEVYTYAKGPKQANFYYDECKFDFVFEEEKETLIEKERENYLYMMIYSLDDRFKDDDVLISINS